MADTSLIFNIIARDKTTAVLAKVQRQAQSTGSLIAKALGPYIVPVLAAGTTGILGMGAALGAAGAAAGVFGAVTGSAMTEVSEAATKVEDLRAKMALYGRQAKMAADHGMEASQFANKQAKANLELQARLAELPPATRAATMAYLDMKSGWEGFVEQNKPAVYGTLQSGYQLIGNAIGRLQPLFDIGKAAADRLIGSMTKAVDGGFIERMATRAKPALASLTNIVINVSRALGGMMGRSSGQGQAMLNWIEKMTAKWAAWSNNTSSESGFTKFLAYAQQHGPAVVTMLGNLVTAARNIVQALTPFAPISLAIATALTSMIAAAPPGVITALVAAFIAYSAAGRVHSTVTSLMAAKQWILNSALLASPITWIVVAIGVLIGVIVYLATKTQFFQTVWGAVWGFMKQVGAWFAGPFAGFFVKLWNGIVDGVTKMKNGVVERFNAVKAIFTGLYNHGKAQFTRLVTAGATFLTWINGIPGKIRGALGNVFGPLWAGFKSAINRIIAGWNNLSFSIGGGSFAGINIASASFGTPNIPYLATGGDITRTGLAVVHKGERVTKAAAARRTGPGTGLTPGARPQVVFKIEGGQSKVVRVLLELLRDGIRDQGGNPVHVLEAR